jgi:hypothetical protein
VKYAFFIRVLGVCCLGVSIVELTIAVPLYEFLVNLRLGAWWAVVAIGFGGICSMIQKSRRWVTAGCVWSGLGCVLGILGSITDGIASKTFEHLTSCAQPTEDAVVVQPLEYYGTSSTFYSARQCFVSEVQYHSIATQNCYCAGHLNQTEINSVCDLYILSDKAVGNGANCGDLLDYYTESLSTSGSLIFAATLLALCLSVLSCTTLCCVKPKPTETIHVALLA